MHYPKLTRNNYILFCTILLTLLPVFYSTLTTFEITATDWLRHIQWIERYISGDFMSFLEYPPLFHLIMLPLVFINFPVVIMQIIFSVLSLAAILYFFRKFEGFESMIILSMLLATSLAYIQISGALMPQVLDPVFMLLAMNFYLKKGYDKFSVMIFSLLMLHGAGMIFAFIFLLHIMFTGKWDALKWLILPCIIAAPIYYCNWFIPYEMDYLGWDQSAQNEWDRQFWDPIWNYFIMSGFFTWSLFPISLKNLKDRNYYISETQLFYVFWALCFIPVGIIGYGWWRLASISMIPFSMFVASLVSDKK